MILARDTGRGTQAQDVAWRAVLEGSLTNTGTETWGTVLTRTPWTRARATELSWAKVVPVAIPYGQPADIAIVRVVYELRWFKGGTSQVVGRARHTPLTYGLDFISAPDDWSSGHCYTEVP